MEKLKTTLDRLLYKFSLVTFLWITTSVMNLGYASPPFITDDAETENLHQLQIYLFSSVIAATHTTNLFLPAMEADYGILKNTETHVLIPILTYIPDRGGRTVGLGDTEIGFKHLFLEEKDYCPEVSIEPFIGIPTGDAERNLGNGKSWYQISIIAEKHWKKWASYVEAGVVLNPGAHMKNYDFAGIVLQKNINDNFFLGAEIYSQGSTATNRLPPNQDSAAVTVFNLGGDYSYNKNTSLLFSAGHSFIGTQAWFGYLGLLFTIS